MTQPISDEILGTLFDPLLQELIDNVMLLDSSSEQGGVVLRYDALEQILHLFTPLNYEESRYYSNRYCPLGDYISFSDLERLVTTYRQKKRDRELSQIIQLEADRLERLNIDMDTNIHIQNSLRQIQLARQTELSEVIGSCYYCGGTNSVHREYCQADDVLNFFGGR